MTDNAGEATTTDRESAFWSLIARGSEYECWLWQGGLTSKGYGRFSVGRHGNVVAHRFAYELLIGPIPDGLVIDHLCRNRACQNPAHMEPVTNQVNVLRGVGPTAQLARRTHCTNGHEYTPANTYLRPDGGRRCVTCKQDWNRRQRVTA